MIAARRHDDGPRDHVVHFYRDDDDLMTTAGRGLANALGSKRVAIVAAIPAHMRALESHVAELGIDPEAARANGRLLTIDAGAVASRLMQTGSVDEAVFEHEVARRVVSAAGQGGDVWVYGEIVAVLWERGLVVAALALEELWNALRARARFELLCGYSAPSIAPAQLGQAVAAVCRLHSDIVGSPTGGQRILEDAGETRVARRFAPSPGAPGAARRFLLEMLERWDMTELDDDAALIVSELATNAIRHTRSEFTVAIDRQGPGLRICVEDGSSELPAVVPVSGSLAISGRGLRIVSALASRWSSEPRGTGKVVWADLIPGRY